MYMQGRENDVGVGRPNVAPATRTRVHVVYLFLLFTTFLHCFITTMLQLFSTTPVFPGWSPLFSPHYSFTTTSLSVLDSNDRRKRPPTSTRGRSTFTNAPRSPERDVKREFRIFIARTFLFYRATRIPVHGNNRPLVVPLEVEYPRKSLTTATIFFLHW